MKKLFSICLLLCLLVSQLGGAAFADGRQTNVEYNYAYNIPAALAGDMTEEDLASLNEMLSTLTVNAYANDTEAGAALWLGGVNFLTALIENADEEVRVMVNGTAFAFRAGDLIPACSNLIDALVVLGFLDAEQAELAHAYLDQAASGEGTGLNITTGIDLSQIDLEAVTEVLMEEIFGNIVETEIEKTIPMDEAEAEEAQAALDKLLPDTSALSGVYARYLADETANAVCTTEELYLGTDSLLNILSAVVEAMPDESGVIAPDMDELRAVHPEFYLLLGMNEQEEPVYADVVFSIATEETETTPASVGALQLRVILGSSSVKDEDLFQLDIVVADGESNFSVQTVGVSAEEENAGMLRVFAEDTLLGEGDQYRAEYKDKDAEYEFGYGSLDLSPLGLPVFTLSDESTTVENGEDETVYTLVTFRMDGESVMEMTMNLNTGDPEYTEITDAYYPADMTGEELAALLTEFFSNVAEAVYGAIGA